MTRVPWFKSNAEQEPTWYVLEIDNPNGPGKLYMSRAGMEDETVPIWDTLDKAAITDERNAQGFAQGFAQWFTPPPPGLRPVPEQLPRVGETPHGTRRSAGRLCPGLARPYEQRVRNGSAPEPATGGVQWQPTTGRQLPENPAGAPVPMA